MQEIREFLLKENLRVPSPDAIPELASRLGTDLRFRADMASLMRATLYREREGIGYEELLGILVAAAAGTKQDLTSDSQEADIREMLRFLLQSRRPSYRQGPEEERVGAELEPREPVPVHAEPVHAAAMWSAAQLMTREPRVAESAVAVAEAESREPADVVLPVRTAGRVAAEPESFAAQPELFAAQPGLEEPWWRVHSSWLVGAVCLVLGVGAGLMIHRSVPAAHTHVAVAMSDSAPSVQKPATRLAAKQSAGGKPRALVARKHSPAVRRQPVGGEADAGKAAQAPAETVQTASVPDAGRAAESPSAAFEGRSTPPAVAPEKSAAVPMTVVKQVVRASLNPVSDDSGDPDDAPLTAETHSIVHPGSAGIMAANVVYSPPPDYPAAASAARVQGEVTVRAVVDPEGHVIYARVVSGPELLRDAALEAVQKWRYRPLLYYGKPIAVTTTAILDFKVVK